MKGKVEKRREGRQGWKKDEEEEKGTEGRERQEERGKE